jgi:hypothetical protein
VASLTDGPPGGDFELYARRPFAPRLPRWAWIGIVSWLLAGFVLLVVPILIGWLGGRYQDDVTDELRACRDRGTEGLDDAETADLLFRIEGWFPFWEPRAKPHRAELVAQVAGGIEACRRNGAAPAGLVDRGVAFVVDRLPEMHDATYRPAALRARIEDFLLGLGREREIVDLERRLPRGGDIELRVRAHLRLGDLAGAARLWREPDAGMTGSAAVFLGRGLLLCLAGDYPAGLTALDETRRAQLSADPAGQSRAAFLGLEAECALRAGAVERLAELVATLDWTRGGAALAARYGAELQRDAEVSELRARVEQDGPAAFDAFELDDQILALALLAGGAAQDELLAAAGGGPARREVEALEGDWTGESLYDDRLHPPVDENRLRQAVDALAGPSATSDGKSATAELLALLAVRLGRRWDPRLEETLDRAAALRPGWPLPERLRTSFRALHGEGQFDGGTALGVRTIVESPAPPLQKLEELLRGAGPPATMSALFLRLTKLIVVGRTVGIDVRRWDEQLQALRRMVDEQPNQRLLRVAEPF